MWARSSVDDWTGGRPSGPREGGVDPSGREFLMGLGSPGRFCAYGRAGAHTVLCSATVGGSVLVVEDERDIAFPLVRTLEREGYDVAWVGTGRRCSTSSGATPSDVVILDLACPTWTASTSAARCATSGYEGGDHDRHRPRRRARPRRRSRLRRRRLPHQAVRPGRAPGPRAGAAAPHPRQSTHPRRPREAATCGSTSDARRVYAGDARDRADQQGVRRPRRARGAPRQGGPARAG